MAGWARVRGCMKRNGDRGAAGEMFSHRRTFLLCGDALKRGCTYHHLIYRVNYVVHLVPRDKAVVVHVVQAEGP